MSWTGEQPHLCQDIFVFASPAYYPFPPRPLTPRAGGPGFAALRTLFSPVFLSERPSGAPDPPRPGRKALPPHGLDINPNSKICCKGVRPVMWPRGCGPWTGAAARSSSSVTTGRCVPHPECVMPAPRVLGGRAPGFPPNLHHRENTLQGTLLLVDIPVPVFSVWDKFRSPPPTFHPATPIDASGYFLCVVQFVFRCPSSPRRRAARPWAAPLGSQGLRPALALLLWHLLARSLSFLCNSRDLRPFIPTPPFTGQRLASGVGFGWR